MGAVYAIAVGGGTTTTSRASAYGCGGRMGTRCGEQDEARAEAEHGAPTAEQRQRAVGQCRCEVRGGNVNGGSAGGNSKDERAVLQCKAPRCRRPALLRGGAFNANRQRRIRQTVASGHRAVHCSKRHTSLCGETKGNAADRRKGKCARQHSTRPECVNHRTAQRAEDD